MHTKQRIPVPKWVGILIVLVLTGCGSGNFVPAPAVSPSPNPNPQPDPEPPTLQLSPEVSTLTLGASTAFSLEVSGDPGPTVDCTPVASGSLTLNPGSIIYDAPTSPPANFDTNNTVNFTCTATNSAGSDSVLVTINLEYPVPEITLITPGTIFCPRECIVGGIKITGSGFYGGGVLHNVDDIFGDLVLAAGTNPNEISINLPIGASVWSPGWFDFTVSSPSTGPGGGTSEIAKLAFLGNQNTLAFSATEAFQLDQGAGLVRVFDPAIGVELQNFSVGRLIYHIAVDDVTSYVLLTQSNRGVSWVSNDGTGGGAATNDLVLMAVAAKGKWGCVTQDLDDQIACFELSQGQQPMLPLFIGLKPWNIAMTKLADQLVAAVFNIEDLEFSVVDVVPSVQLLRSLTLSGLTPASQLPPAAGGWQLAVFDDDFVVGIGSGPGPLVSYRPAALLHQYDKVVVLVDLLSGQEMGRVDLSDYNPFRIVADNANGALIVADVDVEAGLTRFLKIDMAGNVTELQATTDLLAAGMAVSSDGSNLYLAMRDQFQILPNN